MHDHKLSCASLQLPNKRQLHCMLRLLVGAAFPLDSQPQARSEFQEHFCLYPQKTIFDSELSSPFYRHLEFLVQIVSLIFHFCMHLDLSSSKTWHAQNVHYHVHPFHIPFICPIPWTLTLSFAIRRKLKPFIFLSLE